MSRDSSVGQLLEGKRFGVVLSSGFFGFYGHAGFLKAFEARKLVPSAWAGSSAGGMIAAYAAGGSTADELALLVGQQTRGSFWDPDVFGALLDVVRQGPRMSGLLRGDRFRKLLEKTLPVPTFEACRQKLVLVAANLTKGTSEAFTRGPLAPVVHATCAYPGLFRAVDLGGELFWDGGLVDKAPVLALAESEVGRSLEALVVHFLPSRPDGALKGALAYAQGIGIGMTALRRDHFRLQLELLRARGVPTYVIVSRLPALSPRSMEQGPQVLTLARQSVERALENPPQDFEQLA